MHENLTQHDAEEVAKFQQYLADRKTMEPRELFEKYRGYLGLSAEEAEKILPSIY
jgi:hypothetical protein